MSGPYRVEADTQSLAFRVRGPDGYVFYPMAGSMARHLAEFLNAAYAAGRERGRADAAMAIATDAIATSIRSFLPPQADKDQT